MLRRVRCAWKRRNREKLESPLSKNIGQRENVAQADSKAFHCFIIDQIRTGDKMLNLKDAIKKSFQYLEEMYEGVELPNKLLEEIEYDDSSDIWKVVIGFDSNRITTTKGSDMFGSMLGSSSTVKKERNYKQIRFKGADGSFIKMLDQML